jgi:hypothetical protein
MGDVGLQSFHHGRKNIQTRFFLPLRPPIPKEISAPFSCYLLLILPFPYFYISPLFKTGILENWFLGFTIENKAKGKGIAFSLFSIPINRLSVIS